jgi:peroxiredoxin Q/BCP
VERPHKRDSNFTVTPKKMKFTIFSSPRSLWFFFFNMTFLVLILLNLNAILNGIVLSYTTKEQQHMVQNGSKAPAFSLKDDRGSTVKLSDFSGKKMVLYFYPRDNTPGCTKEACSFRDVYDEMLAKGAVIIGVSTDSVESHRKFRERHGLPFYLLTDEEHKAAEAYGVWAEKKLYGKTYFGIIRSTFIIDEHGLVVKTFPTVKPENHGQEILALL